MPRARTLLLLLASAWLVGDGFDGPRVAHAQEVGQRQLPFSDDPFPPPPLPQPLDRHLAGRITEFDGERVRLEWDWSDEAQLSDFDPFVPVRASLDGGFTLEDGRLRGRGTAGLRLRLAMHSDLTVETEAELAVPHDLGIVLAKPGSSDESILCLIQDRFFTEFDDSANNSTMINKIGGIPATAPGHVEFRYVDRKKQPVLAAGDTVQFKIVRQGPGTSFALTPRKSGAKTVTLSGSDTDTPMQRFTPGLFTAGGDATYGPLSIEGEIDRAWCESHAVLPHIASDLLHPGNRFRKHETAAAKLVEAFVAQPGERPAADDPEAESWVEAEQLVEVLGRAELPLVIRIRAAEALIDDPDATSDVGTRVADLLDAESEAVRTLAWMILRPRLPWHFRYESDGDPTARREAALLVGDYFRSRDEALAMGHVFVEGAWYTPHRADELRRDWSKAWDLRSSRIRLKTNLPWVWAKWYRDALEAQYDALVEEFGVEPPQSRRPLNVFVFWPAESMEEFCRANGYERFVGWSRFADEDRLCAFVLFPRNRKDQSPTWALNQNAKLFLRAATNRPWPEWYREGRASWYGNGDYQTASFAKSVLRYGLDGSGPECAALRVAVVHDEAWTSDELMGQDPRKLEPERRRIWYVQCWALYDFLVTDAPDEMKKQFARWLSLVENLDAGPREVDAAGRLAFRTAFPDQGKALDEAFVAWVKNGRKNP